MTDDPRSDTRDPSHDLQRVAAGTGLGIFGALFRSSLTALTALLLARLLSRPDFGLVTLGTSLIVLLAVIGKLGQDVSTGRFTAIYLDAHEEGKVKGVIYGGLLWATAASVLLAGLVSWQAPRIAGLFLKPEFARPLGLFVWAVPPLVLSLVIGVPILAQGSARARVFVRNLTVPALYGLFALAAVLLRPQASSAALAYTWSCWCGLALAIYYLRRAFPRLSSVRGCYQSGMLLMVGLPNLLTDLAAVGLTQSDVVIVGRLLPAALVGFYALAAHLSILGTLPLNSLNQIFSPVVSRLHHQGQVVELNHLFKTFTRLMLTLSIPILMVFVALARPLMGLPGPDFVSAAPVLIIASAGVLANVITGPVGYALVMAGYQWYAFVVNLFSLAALVGMMWWLTPRYGIVGAAMGLAISSATVNLVRLLLVRKFLGVNPLSGPMVKSLAAGCLAGAIIYALAHLLHVTGREPLYLLVPVVLGLSAIGMALYAGGVHLLGLEESDRQAGRAVLQRIRAQFSGR